MHSIDYYKKMAFDPKQMQLIRDGLKDGLDVEWYANTSFDYLQMEEIYLALKADLDDESLNMLCDPRIPYESMKQMRENMFEAAGIYEMAREEVKRKKIIRYIIIVAFLLISFAVSSVIYINRDTISYYFEDINLTLKTDHIKLGISESFVAGDYIDKYDKNFKLTLPTEKRFEDIGTYTVTYKLSNQVKSVTKNMIIDVYDDVKPNIELKTDSVDVEFGSEFNKLDYVVSVTDNIDGDLSKKLVCEGDVSTIQAGKYELIYKVSDKAGNEMEKQLSVSVKDKPVEVSKNRSSGSNKTADNSSSDRSSNRTPSSKSSSSKTDNPSVYNKYFSGYSISSYDAAVAYAEGLLGSGKISGYEVNPSGDGIQVICR